jgi:hypothetical protein
LSKPYKLADFLDALLVDPLAPSIAGAARRGTFAAAVAALQLRHHLLHGTTRDELDDHEGQQQDAEQRGDHQQQALEDVGGHGPF